LILCVAAALVIAGCAKPRSTAPLLSAAPSAAADNDIYIADAKGRIRAFSSEGAERWTYSLSDEMARLDQEASHDIRIDYLVARSGGKLFGLATELSGRNAGKTVLFALDGSRLLWQVDAPSPAQGSAPVAIGQTAVYEAGDDGVLYAFARADGHQLWQYRVSQGTLGAPTVSTDGTIYVTGPRHNLHAIAPDGTQRWVIETEK
jgi:outer membrane protein assembly factor BamB